MTDPNLTHIAIVLDKSGSMGSVRAATISGFNEFIEKQKLATGQALVDLLLFNEDMHRVYRSHLLSSVEALTNAKYVPSGNTALYDAIGVTIDTLGSHLVSLPEASRPGKVVIVVMTDGMENASVMYKRERIREMIEHQRSRYAWEFIFLGANQDAVLTGTELGVKSDNSVSYSSDDKSVVRTMALTAEKVTSFRATGDANALNYNSTDRQETMGEIP